MTGIDHFAERRPFWFALLTILVWFVLSGVLVGLSSVLLNMSFMEPLIQGIGSTLATIILLIVCVRLGWIKKIGVTRIGSVNAWIGAVVVGSYMLLVNLFAFFENVHFDYASLLGDQAQAIMLRDLQVGFVEEVLFRGIILFVLLRVWGKSFKGLAAAVIVQAVLFGAFHSLQVLAGVDLANVAANIFATFVFSVWLGAIVLIAETVWPAVLLHALGNAIILIKGLSSPWIVPNYLGYLRAASFELPLVLLTFWVLWRVRSKAADPIQVEND